MRISSKKKHLTSSNYNALNQKGISSFKALSRIEKELEEDGHVEYDLGSYTTIEMLPEANFIIHKLLGKNLVNQNEYHKTTKIHKNLVKAIGNFLHVPNVDSAFGSSTAGSSEAIFLAILAAKWSWKNRGQNGQPNIVFCSNAHLCWYKFAKYLDVEVREVALESTFEYPLEKVIKNVDQNTICVVAILGCTYMGTCDPIAKLNTSLEKLNLEKNWDIGIHVDAAIGGFVIPFLKEESNQKWDFKLPLVRSINLSGHKYGLVYPGLGWILFRNESCFQSELSLNSNYLSGSSESFTINFSRSSSLVIAQYFNFLHYGFEGYQKVVEKCMNHTKLFSKLLTDTSKFEIVSNGKLPVVIFTFKEASRFDEKAFTKLLRNRKWMLPYYQLSGKLETTVMRVVVRDDMTEVLIKLLVNDLMDCYNELDNFYK